MDYLPEDLKRLTMEEAFEVLSLYVIQVPIQFDTIVSEFEAFNHSELIYPRYVKYLHSLDCYIEELSKETELPSTLKQLKYRSSDDPIIMELIWEHNEYVKPVAVQSVKILQISSERRSSNQINNLIKVEDPIVSVPDIEEMLLYSQRIEQNKELMSIQLEQQMIPMAQLCDADIVEQQIQLAQQLSEDAYLDEAFQIIQNLKPKSEFINPKHNEFINMIEKKMELLIFNTQEIDNKDGWIIEKQTPTMTIKYKFPPKSDTVTLYMESIFNANITRLMALVNEVDLYHNYVPFCMGSTLAKAINRQTKVCDLQLYFPLISNRQALLMGEGIDRLKINGTIVFLCRGVENDPEFLQTHDIHYNKENSKFVRLEINYYLFELTPLGENKCRVRAVTNSDPQIRYMPQSFVALVARKLANQLFERMQKISQNFEKSAWYPRYQSNLQFYNWIDEKVQDHFRRIG